MTAEIRSFFESYRDAFNLLDAEGVTGHYAFPCMIAHASGQGLFTGSAALLDNNTVLCRQYREGGYEEADFEEHSFIGQGGNFAIADLRWTIRRHAGNEPWRFRTSYNLRRDDGEWKILMVTAYEEKRLGKEEHAS